MRQKPTATYWCSTIHIPDREYLPCRRRSTPRIAYCNHYKHIRIWASYLLTRSPSPSRPGLFSRPLQGTVFTVGTDPMNIRLFRKSPSTPPKKLSRKAHLDIRMVGNNPCQIDSCMIFLSVSSTSEASSSNPASGIIWAIMLGRASLIIVLFPSTYTE